MSRSHLNGGSFPIHPDETFAVELDATDYGTSGISMTTTSAYDITDLDNVSDVTGTVITGSSSVSSGIITTAQLTSGTDGKTYLMETFFTHGGNTYVAQTKFYCVNNR